MLSRFIKKCSDYSLPLIVGVFVALLFANVFPETYHYLVHHEVLKGKYWSTLHFFVNDIFMVFFFGIAAKEIVESCLPGGSLNPIKKAINPLFATLGGVLIPVGVFFLLTYSLGVPELNRGWGIPTATDIALAWLAAKVIFGKTHPAINFLLLLAIVDDAIGLGIIAIFYGDPLHPTNPTYLLFVLAAMILGFIMNRFKIQNWLFYVLGPGLLSWYGLYTAHLHPALALVFVVPFLPATASKAVESTNSHHAHSPLENFEHSLKLYVDFGLFFFAFANAGVMFSSVGTVTWIILASLLIGKTIGIAGLSLIGKWCGFPLPNGMGIKELTITGMIAGIGLTVALFVSGAAYQGEGLDMYQGPAKMGALLSGFGFLFAWIMAKIMGVKPIKDK